MRYAKLAFALFGLAAVLIAAEPFAGTWKLNLEKTKYKTGTAPKEQTLTIAESGSDLDVRLNGTASDGSAIASHYTVPAQGGQGQIIEAPYDTVSGKRIGPNERAITYTKGGRAVLTADSRVSADGKSITVNVKGTDAQGKAVDGVAVYDKQ